MQKVFRTAPSHDMVAWLDARVARVLASQRPSKFARMTDSEVVAWLDAELAARLRSRDERRQRARVWRESTARYRTPGDAKRRAEYDTEYRTANRDRINARKRAHRAKLSAERNAEREAQRADRHQRRDAEREVLRQRRDAEREAQRAATLLKTEIYQQLKSLVRAQEMPDYYARDRLVRGTHIDPALVRTEHLDVFRARRLLTRTLKEMKNGNQLGQ